MLKEKLKDPINKFYCIVNCIGIECQLGTIEEMDLSNSQVHFTKHNPSPNKIVFGFTQTYQQKEKK